MLHPDLKLQNIFEHVDQKATRDGYGDALLALGESNPNIVVLTADLAESTREEAFEKKFPERFFECGVAEQNMAAVAAGMGVSGKIPFMSSYATFSPGKNWETIRTTIVYNQANVKIAGHHAGIMTGPDGPTHQATEDIAITRCLPGMQVLVPCDYWEAYKATMKAAEVHGPVYLRFTREATPMITTRETPFEIGKAYPFWVSAANSRPEVAILSTGHMTYYALLAADVLEKEGISVTVINTPSIKPLDTSTILEFVKKAGSVVTVEDHQVTGGLGGAIAELLVTTYPCPMECIGLQDTFAESGNPIDLLEKYHMKNNDIYNAVHKVLTRKVKNG